MGLDLGWADGALLFFISYFSSLRYLGVGDEENGVGCRYTAQFSLGEAVDVVGVGGVPCFGIGSTGQRWVFFGLTCDFVDDSVCLRVSACWGQRAFWHGTEHEGDGGSIGVFFFWDVVDVVGA